MTDDRQILDDYILWSTTKELDTSIDAFLAERKAEADARRVAEAIERLSQIDTSVDHHDNKQLIQAWRTITDAQSILIDDRPTVDEGTLTERRTRTL